MTEAAPREVVRKVRKLAQLPEEVRHSRWAVSVTRLTVLKSLCQEPQAAHRFVTSLARKTLERVERGQRQAERLPPETARAHRELMAEALAEMESWIEAPSEARRQGLRDLLARMQAEQNEYRSIPWGAVRLIHDADLLLVEYALRCLLAPPREAPRWAYQTARHYAERYDPSHGTGLIPESAPLVQDIADFWVNCFGIDPSAPPARPRPGTEPQRVRSRPRARAGTRAKQPPFTPRQGQFLAFIHLYCKLHRRGPAELDLVQFFRVTPPAVHGMLVKLEELGLVTREPGVARSVRVALPEKQIPRLEDIAGPPW
jgi:hypothetical protein